MMDAIGIKMLDASAPRAEAQQDSVRQEQALPSGSPAAARPVGPYYSPILRLDSETQRTVIQYRDVTTGKVQIQYPSERQLEAYRMSLRQRPEEEEAVPSVDERNSGQRARSGHRPDVPASLRRVPAFIADGASPEDRGRPASAATGGGRSPAHANHPAPRLAAITA